MINKSCKGGDVPDLCQTRDTAEKLSMHAYVQTFVQIWMPLIIVYVLVLVVIEGDFRKIFELRQCFPQLICLLLLCSGQVRFLKTDGLKAQQSSVSS